MSQTVSIEEFVRSVSESGLLSGADLRASLDGLGGEAAVADAAMLAGSLVRAGQLTTFQSAAILEGRSSGLCMGNYDILDRLGSGGMGTVFKARHRRMKRVVALKVIARTASEENSFARRFQREVETIAQFSHPNIVMAFDADEAEEGLYLVMEFVDGHDLGREVAEGGPLSVRDAVGCVLQAARGLAYAHDRGVVHRDVKPANLLRDGGGVVKVADLGLARLIAAEMGDVGASLTQSGGILGTADYMAPEQALDSATVDHRADIYSLGCTLYFLLAGKPHYTAASLMALLWKHREAPTPPLLEARPDVPDKLDELHRRMTAKSPDDRPQDMAEVIRVLEGLGRDATLSDARPDAAQAGSPFHDVTVAIAPGGSAGPSSFLLEPAPSDRGSVPTPSEASHPDKLTVVLVEPSRTQAGIVRRYLLQLGIEDVRVTGSGRQALGLAKQGGAHVILSSMQLEDMTGVQLARSLRDDPACSGVGFILASSESDGVEPGESPDTPPMILLSKPFDSRRLARSLAQATGRVIGEATR